MDTTSRSWVAPAAILAMVLVIVVAVMATGVFGRSVSPSPAPSESPAPTAPVDPTPTPSDEPSEQPSEQPSQAPADGIFEIDLDIATNHDVSAVFTDATDTVTAVTSGRAGDGMSVRWGDVIVQNVSSTVVRVTWVGLAQIDTVKIDLVKDGDEYALSIDQKAPPANSDATGFDRVIDIEFDGDLSADLITASVSN